MRVDRMLDHDRLPRGDQGIDAVAKGAESHEKGASHQNWVN
jgi:hypothetical protein